MDDYRDNDDDYIFSQSSCGVVGGIRHFHLMIMIFIFYSTIIIVTHFLN